MRRLLSSVVVLAVLSFASAPQHSSAAVSGGSGDSHSDFEVFVREGCPHCAAAKLFLQDLQRERPALRIRIRDIGKDAAALRRLKDLVGQRQDVRPGVPAFYLRGELIIGYASEDTTGQRIRSLLDRPESELPLENACPPDEITCTPEIEEIEVPLIGRLNIQKLGLPLFTFALGLIDGFNPCSVWVLVLMLSLLVNLKDRMKILLIAGTFVAVQGLAYFLFMAAWLNAFLLVGLSRTTEVMLGWVAIVAGAIHLKDAWGRGRGVSLSIPEAAKPGLYTRIRSILLAENLKAAILAAVVLAVMVQIVELLCTAGLPALYTRILTMRQLNPWAYYGYLGLYNLAYMLDDIIVLAIGVITLSRRRLQEKEGRMLQAMSGAVMLALGLVLLLRPEWLIR